MSDLLIKGMEMPKCCCDCKIFSGEGYLCPLLEDSAHWLETVRNKRVADCPLVEIPTPHGRLVTYAVVKNIKDKRNSTLNVKDSKIISSISSEIEFVPKDASIEHFPADVYFENGRMTFIFDNAMLSMEIDNTKLEKLKALIKHQRE